MAVGVQELEQGMLTELRRADELRIGDRVVTADGTLLTVTSTRMQGVGAGVVVLGLRRATPSGQLSPEGRAERARRRGSQGGLKSVKDR